MLTMLWNWFSKFSTFSTIKSFKINKDNETVNVQQTRKPWMTNINKKYWKYNTYWSSEHLKKWMASRPKHLKDEHKPKCDDDDDDNEHVQMMNNRLSDE
jgi:hypothetical protein